MLTIPLLFAAQTQSNMFINYKAILVSMGYMIAVNSYIHIIDLDKILFWRVYGFSRLNGYLQI